MDNNNNNNNNNNNFACAKVDARLSDPQQPAQKSVVNLEVRS